MEKEILLIKDLKMYYPVKVKTKGLLPEKKSVKAVNGVSFSVNKGETLGIVGESGCGKTTVGKTIVKLLTPTSGNIYYKGKDIFKQSKQEDKNYKKEVQMIFQDPYSSLDPRFNVGRIIAEPFYAHNNYSKKEKEKIVLDLMEEVGLRKELYYRYPHEFSGGQRQRIGVARALALNPSLIICDEPVSALDVSIQAQILNLMKELQNKYNLTLIFITHDLSVVKHISDRIIVMYFGNIVEIADKAEIFNNHKHPYTSALIDAIPIPDPEIKSMNQMIEGEIPSATSMIKGCSFYTRCKFVKKKCVEIKPQLVDIGNGHMVSCHLYN